MDVRIGGQLEAAASAAARMERASTPELPGLFNMLTRMAISVLRCGGRETATFKWAAASGCYLL